MKKFYPPLFFGGLIILLSLTCNSCNKLDSNLPDLPEATSDYYKAQQDFSMILSKAVHDNKELRLFLKNEALRQFDYDNDVFYPFVKDQVVCGSETFRDILVKYSNESLLSEIEQTLPKLNILIPDWSWLGCFSVNSWDATDSDPVVTFINGHEDVEVFENGKYIGNLPEEGFPDFPVLIIKSNERMTSTPSTKGDHIEYGFIDEAYNNLNGIDTKVTRQYSEVTVDGVPDISDFVPASEINDRVKKAFDYFSNGERRIYQRDYLYYNMTKEGQQMPRYENVWETIYKFKFDKFSNDFFFDDKLDKTCYDLDKDKMLKHKEDYKKNNSPRTTDQLRKAFYAEGNLEIQFVINVPTKGGGTFKTTKAKSVSFGDVFAIKYVDLKFRHKTAFGRDWYVYTIKEEAILPKWCRADIKLPRWDISTDSNTLSIVITELDETGTSEISYTTKRSFTNNFKVDTSAEGTVDSIKLKLGLGYNYTDVNESSKTEKYTRTQGGIDNLGQAELEYLTPVLKKKATKNGVAGYEVETISSATVQLMILPTSY